MIQEYHNWSNLV